MVRLLRNHRVPARRSDRARAAARRCEPLNARRRRRISRRKRAAFGGRIHPPPLVLRSGGGSGPAAAAKMTHPVGAVVRDDL